MKVFPKENTTQLFHEKYELLEKLGEGAYASVYSCICKETKEKLAVKVFNCKAYSKRRMQEIYNEKDLLVTVAHENVTEIKETFEESDHYYIVLELIEGGEMFDRIIDGGSYTEEDARLQIKIVCETLCHCHKLGVVHLDIKPENLLVNPKNNDL